MRNDLSTNLNRNILFFHILFHSSFICKVNTGEDAAESNEIDNLISKSSEPTKPDVIYIEEVRKKLVLIKICLIFEC